MPEFYTKKCNANEEDRAEPVMGRSRRLIHSEKPKSGNILNGNAARQEGNLCSR
jgi:hypothetical protein